jgi:hypothetical protein
MNQLRTVAELYRLANPHLEKVEPGEYTRGYIRALDDVATWILAGKLDSVKVRDEQ